MVHLRENYWAVEVPEGATAFDINKYSGNSELNYWEIKNGEQDLIVINLPPGTWQIVCTSKDATYQEAVTIIETQGGGFKDYDKESIPGIYPYTSPFESLRSLLTSKACDVNKNHLVLKENS